ncbi:hypothetical protein AAXE64_07665 [Priestia megaterium]
MTNLNYNEMIKKVTLETDEVTQRAVDTMLDRTSEEVLEDLARNWNNFKEATKLKLAMDIAGTYNLSRTVALMNGINAKLNN